ncbi:hypothetical protein [Vibrio salinus]|uniref:hypothetical protein n=1 Tax=Vibrio salinus TaxID=2899784 RepID=UPI001E2B846C|nr:hypothetical protein [Vibrio salinus]MCE0494155.1 hypothetical protein [Vibrio salinus]
MTFDLDIAISFALKEDDDQQLLELLSRSHRLKLSVVHSMAYALMEMMPPFENYDLATDVLKGWFGTNSEKIAAIFCGYIYVNLQPFDDSFVNILDKYSDCSVANYILALYFDYEGDVDQAKKHIDSSIALRHFPNNLLFKLSLYSNKLNDEKRDLFKREVFRLVTDKQYELSSAPIDVDSLVDSYMSELVLGTYMTSVNWGITKEKYHL